MSVLQSMRRRMMAAEGNDVPRQSFLDSELLVGKRLEASAFSNIQAIGLEHIWAATRLSCQAGWPTSAFGNLNDIDDETDAFTLEGESTSDSGTSRVNV